MPTVATEGEAGSRPPNWDNVPFDVGCARCGHDLRGLTNPKCPACGLAFDWADAVPIEQLTCLHCGYHLYGLRETRCPECGERFTWEEVLTDYRRRNKPLFEYRWRERPIRSFVRTWYLTLRPHKLWSKVDIHDPVKVGPLLVMIAVAIVVFAGSIVILGGFDRWLWQWNWMQTWGRPVSLAAHFARLPRYVLSRLQGPDIYTLTCALILWFTSSLASLMVFRQSMRRCRVRTVHVVRVWAYALPTVAPVVVASLYALECVRVALIPNYWLAPLLPAVIALFLIAFAAWSIHLGYKKYLRMPHSVAVAVASQVMAVLVTGLCELLLLRDVRDSVFLQMLYLFGWS